MVRGPQLEAAIKKNDDLALRKINVRVWGSPVAKQYKIRSLPHYKLYDPKGRLVAEGSTAYKKVLAWQPTKSARTTSRRTAPARPRPPKVKTVSRPGLPVRLSSYVVPGQVTVFEFYADWCKTCKAAGPELRKAVEKADGVVLRRINIKSLESKVARQHRIKTIPHLMLCDEHGKVMEQGKGVLKSVRKRQRTGAAKPGK